MTASIQDAAWPVPAQALGVVIVAVAQTYGVGQRDRRSTATARHERVPG